MIYTKEEMYYVYMSMTLYNIYIFYLLLSILSVIIFFAYMYGGLYDDCSALTVLGNSIRNGWSGTLCIPMPEGQLYDF